MNKSLNNEDLHPNSTFYTFWYLTFLWCSSRCQGCAPASWRFNLFNKHVELCNILALFHRTIYNEISYIHTSTPLKTTDNLDFHAIQTNLDFGGHCNVLISTSIKNISKYQVAVIASPACIINRGAPCCKWKFFATKSFQCKLLTFKNLTLNYFPFENGIFHNNFLNC